MCIAIFSPLGTKIPSDVFLKNSWLNNPDGGGFAFNLNGRVRIQKGYMHFHEFVNALHEADEKYDLTKRGVLIHARIATHGGVTPECCHPFPLVGDLGMMKKLKSTCDYAVVHNGIISLTSSLANKNSGASDTMLFIDKYMSKIASNKAWFNNSTNMELIYDLADSKIAVLDGNGNIKSTPGFTKGPDGNYYSNTSYNYSSSYTYYNTAWDDYVYDGKTYVEPNKLSYREFMRIKNTHKVYIEDSRQVCYGDETGKYCDMYLIDKNNNLYESYLPEHLPEKDILDDYIFRIGKARVYDENGMAVPFTKTYRVPVSLIIDDEDTWVNEDYYSG